MENFFNRKSNHLLNNNQNLENYKLSKEKADNYNDNTFEQYSNNTPLFNNRNKIHNLASPVYENLHDLQKNALENFRNLNQSQAIFNYDIKQKHTEFVNTLPEYFTEDIHHEPVVYSDPVSKNIDLSLITRAPKSNNEKPMIITIDAEPDKIKVNQKPIKKKKSCENSGNIDQNKKYSIKSMSNLLKEKTNIFGNKTNPNGYFSNFCGDTKYEGVPIFKCGLDILKSFSSEEKLEDIPKNLHNFKTEKDIADYCYKNEFCRGYTPEVSVLGSNGVLEKKLQLIMDIPDKYCKEYKKEWDEQKTDTFGYKYPIKGYCRKKNVNSNHYPSDFCRDNRYEGVPIFKCMANLEKSIFNRFDSEKKAIDFCDKEEFCRGYFSFNGNHSSKDIQWGVLIDVPDKDCDKAIKKSKLQPTQIFDQAFKGYCRKK